MDEIIRPKWRNGDKIMSSLNDDMVKNTILKFLVPKENNSALLPEATSHFVPTVMELRYTDLAEFKYWFVMWILVFFFLISELIICLIKIPAIDTYRAFLIVNVVLIVIAAMFMAMYAYIVYIFYSGDFRSKFEKMNAQFLHAFPVIVLAFGLLLSHLILIAMSGGYNSPFLPSLFATALILIGLPRENSIPIYLICFIVIGLVAYGTSYTSGTVNIEKWGGKILVDLLNMFTFIYASISSIILREIGSKKVIK